MSGTLEHVLPDGTYISEVDSLDHVDPGGGYVNEGTTNPPISADIRPFLWVDT